MTNHFLFLYLRIFLSLFFVSLCKCLLMLFLSLFSFPYVSVYLFLHFLTSAYHIQIFLIPSYVITIMQKNLLQIVHDMYLFKIEYVPIKITSYWFSQWWRSDFFSPDPGPPLRKDRIRLRIRPSLDINLSKFNKFRGENRRIFHRLNN